MHTHTHTHRLVLMLESQAMIPPPMKGLRGIETHTLHPLFTLQRGLMASF